MKTATRPLLTSILFLLATLAAALPSPAPAQAADPPWTIPDATGDANPFGPFSPVPVPQNAASNPVDIVEVGITEEDEMGIEFYVKVAGLEGDPTRVLGNNNNQYDIEASLQGTKIHYEMEWWVPAPGPTENPSGIEPTAGRFCFRIEDDNDFRGCLEQNVEATVNWDENLVRAYVTKSALMGLDSVDHVPTAFPPSLVKGDQLVDVFAQAQGGFGGFYDTAPNDGPSPNPYSFKTDAANTKIRLALDVDPNEIIITEPTGPQGGGGFPGPAQSAPANQVSVTPGASTVVPIRVENTNSLKRIVNLTAALEDDAQAAKFRLQLVPSVQVPAGEARVVNLIVNATGETQHRDTAAIVLRGTSVGFSEELAALRIIAVASVPPGPDRQTLYFHARENTNQDPLSTAICLAFPFFCFGDRATWMNTLQTDSLANIDDAMSVRDNGFFVFDGGNARFDFEFELDTPLSSDLVMDTSGVITAVLSFNADQAFPADLSMDISTISGLEVAAGTAQGTLGGSPVTITAVPLNDRERVSTSDEGLRVHFTVRASIAGPGAASQLPNFAFVPSESTLTFPFIEDPNATIMNLPGGASVINLQLAGEDSEYVNPGDATLFNATILNEGTEADEADVSFTVSDAAWEVTILPAEKFNLEPGENVLIAVLLKAPKDAPENQIVQVTLNATSPKNPQGISQLRFTAIATTQIEIEDRSDEYVVSEDDKDNIAQQEKKNETPGAGAVLAFVALSVVGLVVGRRRRDP